MRVGDYSVFGRGVWMITVANWVSGCLEMIGSLKTLLNLQLISQPKAIYFCELLLNYVYRGIASR